MLLFKNVQLHIILKLNEVAIIQFSALLSFNKSAEVNRKKHEGAEVSVAPEPILGEPADICICQQN